MEEKEILERRAYYLKCLIRALESKVERVEPFSTEFEDTMEALFKARDEIKSIGIEKLRYNTFREEA